MENNKDSGLDKLPFDVLEKRTLYVAQMAAVLMSTNPNMIVKTAVKIANLILEETVHPTQDKPAPTDPGR